MLCHYLNAVVAIAAGNASIAEHPPISAMKRKDITTPVKIRMSYDDVQALSALFYALA